MERIAGGVDAFGDRAGEGLLVVRGAAAAVRRGGAIRLGQLEPRHVRRHDAPFRAAAAVGAVTVEAR
jgi:hypothetical protein